MSKENQIEKIENNELVDIENIYQDIRNKIVNARQKMLKHIDTTMTEVYWYVGKITYELSDNSTKASYGKKVIEALSSKLTIEFGGGFSFVASQQRIKIGSEYYYPDLIFYNRLAKCFVIIDLKIGKLTHQDIGQMQMYVNYYKKTQMIDGENEPIGILLCADKDDAVVEMTLGDSVKNVYASKYLTYLPTKEELIKIIKDEKELYELANETKVGDNNE